MFREDNRPYIPVKFPVRGRDRKTTFDEAKDRIAAAGTLLYDTYLECAGKINHLRDALLARRWFSEAKSSSGGAS